MKEIERLLQSQKVAAPTDEFDERMEGLLDARLARGSMFFSRSVAIWQAAAAALVVGGLGFWLGHATPLGSSEETAPETVSTLYIIETRSYGVGNAFETVPAVEPFYKPPSPPISVVQTISVENPSEEQPI